MLKNVILMVLFALPAVASAAKQEPALQSAQPFQVQQAKVRQEPQAGEVYSEISAPDRERVLAALDRIAAVVGEGSLDLLPSDARAQVLGDHELVNTVLAKAREDSRQICRREKTLGSTMATTQCVTVAQRERIRNDSRRAVESLQGGKDVKVGN